MRRTFAISMLLLFSLSLISPLLESDVVQASLPSCCRRAGNHHCSMPDEGSQQGKSVGVIAEKCPCMPAATAAFHPSVLAPPTSDAIFAELISHPAIHAQTATQYRISFDRSRQKRGPPILFLL